MSFDIRLQGRLFNREACRAIQYAFLKLNLVNFISKDANQVFYSSVYPLVDSLNDDYDVIIDFPVDSTSSASNK